MCRNDIWLDSTEYGLVPRPEEPSVIPSRDPVPDRLDHFVHPHGNLSVDDVSQRAQHPLLHTVRITIVPELHLDTFVFRMGIYGTGPHRPCRVMDSGICDDGHCKDG